MKQRRLIDVSLMDLDYSGQSRQSPVSALTSRPTSSKARRRLSSARNSLNHNKPSSSLLSTTTKTPLSSPYRRHSSPGDGSFLTTISTTNTTTTNTTTAAVLDHHKNDNKSRSNLSISKSSGYNSNSTSYSDSYSHPSIPLLSVNGKSLDSFAPSRGTSSRVTSGVSRMTLTSSCGGSRRRCRSGMTSTARSSVTGYSSVSFPDFIGSQPGLTVWTIESGHIRQLDVCDHGFFHQGNVYLILKVKTDGSTFMHVWSGALSPERDRLAIHEHASQLDRIIQGASVFSVETQGHETQLILQHFKLGVVVVEGKSRGHLSKVWRYSQRLYRVEGRQTPTATCMKCSSSALAPNRALILDGFPRIYVWLGSEVDHNTRVKAIQLATALRTWQRKGIAHIIVIEKSDTALHEAFVQKLDTDEKTPEPEVEDDADAVMNPPDKQTHPQQHLNLYRINGERVMYDMPFVAKKPLQHKYLTSKDCFLLDSGPHHPLCIWVGCLADPHTLHMADRRAQTFSHHHNYPTTTPIWRLMEGFEPPSFKAAFNNWVDRVVKERQLVRTYNVSNVGKAPYVNRLQQDQGRALCSRTDCRTISQVSELWSDDELLKNNSGKTEVFQIEGDQLTPLMWEQRGVFHNWRCYIVLYKDLAGYGDTHILYYWLGSKSTREDKDKALELVLSMSSEHRHQTFVMRVLDGKETKHFMNVLQNSMVVYDADMHATNVKAVSAEGQLCTSCVSEDGSETADDDVKMFCIQEFIPGCIRVIQVAPRKSSLNSSAAFVVFNSSTAFVWYGKNSTANEREYSKNMLSYFCPDRSRQFDIINEKKEPSKFYVAVTQDGEYPAEFTKHVIHRRPPRLALYSQQDQSFSFYDGFSQEDLNETDIFILDTFDQLQIWYGSSSLDRDHMTLSSVVQTYLDQDLAGRCVDDVHICFVAQWSEPDIFVKHFSSWDKYSYGGVMAFETARKRARQENAIINIDAQMVDLTYTSRVKIPFKELVKGSNLDEDVSRHHKEHHLADKEFTKALGMTRAEFYRLPAWKQQQILSSARLTDTVNSRSAHAYTDDSSQIDFEVIKFVKNCNKLTV